MKQAVLFDFHNTLATCDAWLELEIHTLAKNTLIELAIRGWIEDVTEERGTEAVQRFRRLRAAVRRDGVEISAVDGTQRVLKEMGYDSNMLPVGEVVESLEYALLPSVAMVPGADDLLVALHERGCKLAVVSSAGLPAFVERALEQMGLHRYFSTVVTSAGEGIYKSNPEIFRVAASKLGVSPGQAVHIGDHPVYDVQGAKRAGLSAIWFNAYTHRTSAAHGTPHDKAVAQGGEADAIITDLSQALSALERLG